MKTHKTYRHFIHDTFTLPIFGMYTDTRFMCNPPNTFKNSLKKTYIEPDPCRYPRDIITYNLRTR